MKGNKEWAIEHIDKESGYRLVQTNTKKSAGGKRSFADIVETKEVEKLCKGTLHITFSPEESHIFSDTFPKLKPELLKLQINKRFNDLGLTMDPTGFCHRAKESRERSGFYNCFFLPGSEIENHLSSLTSWGGISRARLIPGAAAIAALMQTITDQPVLVLLIGLKFSQVIVVKDGTPLYSQSLAQSGPGLVEEALIPNAIDFARISVRKDHDITEFHIVSLGEARENINLQDIGIDEWQPDFSTIVSSKEPDMVLKFPQLYGAPFSDSAHDFLPDEFARSWQLQSYSKMVTIFATLMAVGLIGTWFYLQPILEQQQLQYQNLITELNNKKSSLQSRLPETAILNNFNRLVKIRSLYAKDFRLDSLATDLSQALPQNVHVSDIKVQRQSGTLSTTPQPPPVPDIYNTPGAPAAAPVDQLSVPELLQEKNITIALTCITSGSYSEVTTRFEKTVATLATFFAIKDMTWSYRETDNKGQLNCELFPAPEEMEIQP